MLVLNKTISLVLTQEEFEMLRQVINAQLEIIEGYKTSAGIGLENQEAVLNDILNKIGGLDET